MSVSGATCSDRGKARSVPQTADVLQDIAAKGRRAPYTRQTVFVAHLVEHTPIKREVAGSIPVLHSVVAVDIKHCPNLYYPTPELLTPDCPDCDYMSSPPTLFPTDHPRGQAAPLTDTSDRTPRVQVRPHAMAMAKKGMPTN